MCSQQNKGDEDLPLKLPCRRVIKDTGRLLLIFLIGSIATVCGTLVALKMLPLRSLGADGWKVRACKPQLLALLLQAMWHALPAGTNSDACQACRWPQLWRPGGFCLLLIQVKAACALPTRMTNTSRALSVNGLQAYWRSSQLCG